MQIKTGLIHFADSRDDFYAFRSNLVADEIKSLEWIRDEFSLIESDTIRSKEESNLFADKIIQSQAASVLLHIPVWADPILGLSFATKVEKPVLIFGNSKPTTSSMVGLLGLGGALDQVGIQHIRVFDQYKKENRKKIHAFINASQNVQRLKGMTCGLFGGKSLGIFTAVADPAQWQTLFGVDIEYFDQSEIIEKTKELDEKEIEANLEWFKDNVNSINYNNTFTKEKLRLQVMSYIAMKELVDEKKLDFVGVKCQPELSDGFVSQCVSHCLFNSSCDLLGEKEPIVHACESDADGALSMQILKMISGGKPTALLDIRWFDEDKKMWVLANCGALAFDFFKENKEDSGLNKVDVTPHVFGKGGGGALPAVVAPQNITLARLCRKNRMYRLHVLKGEVTSNQEIDQNLTTAAFPQAYVKLKAGLDFLQEFGSNHIHMVSGDFTEDLKIFCDLLNIDYLEW